MPHSSSESRLIRVLIVDDHALFRQGVRATLNQSAQIEVVGEAANGMEAIDLYRELKPDAIVMDINMPQMNGLEATRRIKQVAPEARILMLTVSDAEDALFDAIKAGASGYVLKTAAPETVVDSIRRVSEGEPVIPGKLAVRIIHEMSKPKEPKPTPHVDQLTEREIEVLRQMSTGASNRDIATALFISENTVRNHVRSILEKLHVNNRGQAAAFAMRQGYTLEGTNSEN